MLPVQLQKQEFSCKQKAWEHGKMRDGIQSAQTKVSDYVRINSEFLQIVKTVFVNEGRIILLTQQGKGPVSK